jgi:hypothetical protein
VTEAYNFKDGYTADLARADSKNATPYLYSRFQKFTFPWGNAVGYFVQTTKGTAWPEPNNAQLMYEIRGVTELAQGFDRPANSDPLALWLLDSRF